MKNFKKVLALVLVVATLLSFATVASAITSKDYKDAADIDYTTAVDVLSYIGVLNGYGDGTFKPEGEITRAEAAKIIAMFSNGSTNIEKLYASANPFTDVEKGNWAESYIAYCYKTGIVGGVGNGKFAPNSNVTGIQFIKMALTVLGYDAKKEGLEGASWAVNTLSLAKKAGLLAGLPANFKYEANLKRQEAAQIMLNTLNSNIVDYGYETKNGVTYVKDANGNTVAVPAQYYITTAGAVVVTGKYLYQTWNLGHDVFDDCFMRPGTMWTYTVNNKTATLAEYTATPVAKHQTVVTGCDLLVDAGVAKTNTSATIRVTAYENGVQLGETVTLSHSTGLCNAATTTYGAQGTQAELYFMGYGDDGVAEYRLVLIQTWLAKVDSVAKSSVGKNDHILGGNKTVLKVWYAGAGNTKLEPDTTWETGTTGFAKGDMVLVTFSWKTGCNHVVDVDKATAKDGVLTGFTNVTKAGAPTKTEIDTVETYDALRFYLGYTDSKDINNTQKSTVAANYTFYYDLFGNVIGMTDRAATATQYTVINEIWSHTHRDYTVTADLVNLDATLTKDTNVASVVAHDVDYTETLSALSSENGNFYDRLYTYAKDGDGNYYLTRATVSKGANVEIKAGSPNIWDGDTSIAQTNEYTQYLFRVGTSKYVAYTGYANVPAATATYVEWVDDNADGYADIVYAYGMTFPGSSDIAFTFESTVRYTKSINGVRYDVWTVYIDGKATTVYTKVEQDNATGESNQFTGLGLYRLDYANTDGVVVANVTKLTDATAPYSVVEKTVTSCIDTALKFEGSSVAYNVKDVPVYVVDSTYGEVEVGATSDLTANADVLVLYKSGAIAAIYVIG